MPNRTVYVVAGPNGGGKTTFAKGFIEEYHLPFLNADEIAMKLCPANIQRKRVGAGRLFFDKFKEYVAGGKTFIIETTLAGKYFIRFMDRLKRSNYRVEIIYIFIETVEEAINRINIRIKKGGHPVPEADIKRRFMRSKINFWDIYRPKADNWKIFLNSKDEFLLVATGTGDETEIVDDMSFSIFREGISDEKRRL